MNMRKFFAPSAWRLGGASVVGDASKRRNQRTVTLGGVTHYIVTLGGVTHYVRRAATMLLMMLLTTMTAWAETVETYYIDENGTRHDVTATVLTSVGLSNDNQIVLTPDQWYVINGDADISSTVSQIYANSKGNYNLILADGKTLTFESSDNLGAIYIAVGILNIYGQTLGTGKLKVSATGTYYGDAICARDGIKIVGGIVEASSNGKNGIYSPISVTISGGQVSATGDDRGIKSGGSITLGLRNASDFVHASSYKGTVKVANGQTLTDGTNAYSGTLNSGQIAAIADKTLKLARTVTFDSNGGSAVDAQTVAQGGKATEPAAPTMEGGTFLGWTLNGTDYDFDSAVTDNITLVAKWSVTTYYVDADGTVRDNITATTLTGGGDTELAGGTYVVNSDIEYTGTITLKGDVTIILGDGKTMTVNTSNYYGISYDKSDGKDLTIYGQTAKGGTLNVTANLIDVLCKNITINSGTINAPNNNMGSLAAGYLVTINGGVVMAACNNGINDHAINGEREGVIINGGQVTVAGNSGNIATFPSGNIIFGYTNADDFITFKSIYNYGTVKIADGKVMTDGTNIYNDQTESDVLKALTNTTLRPATYTVTFDSNGGSAVDAQTMLYGVKATAPDSNPTMEGGTFLGWTLNGADYDFDSAVTDNITLVAKWSVTTYYVDADGTVHDNITATTLTGGGATELAEGTYVVNSDISYTGTVTLGGDVTIILGEGKTMTVNTSDIGIYGGADFLNFKNLTIYGQTAQGGTLSVTAGGEGIWCRDITINSGTVNANTTSYRTITAMNLLIINGGMVTATNTANDLYAISGEFGVSINGGQVTATGNGGNIDANLVTFGYKNTSDFITFKGISSTITVTVKIADGKAMTDGTNIYDENTESDVLKALTNTTLRPVTTWVYFRINYDDGTNPTSQNVCYGMKVTEPTIAARTGYIFGGWYTDSDFTDGSLFDFAAPVSTTSNINLYAKWTPITYTVEFDKNNDDATGTMASVVANYDQWTSIPNCTFTAPEGYALKEWNRQADGSGDSFYAENGDFRNLASEQGAVVTLYAQWGKNIALCTADVPDPIYHSYSFHGYFYDGTWNDNHGNIKVYDGKTLLTYGTDYQYKTMESLDGKSCEELGEHCRVYLQGIGAYAGTLYKDVVIAPATVTNATWGSLTWNLDADGNFTITGTGAMKAADNYYSYPWYNYGSYFTSITIGTGITTVAAGAFGGTQNVNNYGGVTSVTLPTSLTEIGENAFAYCTGATFNADNLIAQGVTIGDNAFNQVGCIVGTLTNNGDNSNMLSLMANARSANVTIKGRTLYKDGNWNTICLPFDVKSDNALLTDATIKELDTDGYYDAAGEYYPYYNANFTRTGFDAENGALYLYFKDATADSDDNLLKARTPYLIKWPSGTDITGDLTFEGVKVNYSPQTLTSEDKNVSFRGTFSPTAIAVNDKSCLFLSTSKNDQDEDVSTLYYPSATNYTSFPGLAPGDASDPDAPQNNYYIGAFRAYFHVDLNGGANAVRSFVLNFGDSSESTGIREIDTDPAPSPGFAPPSLRSPIAPSSQLPTGVGRSAAWYSLDGRKLDGKPTKSGVYIHNGLKVVIRSAMPLGSSKK